MKQDRRDFLKRSCAALSMTAMATQMRHFGLVDVLAQQMGQGLGVGPAAVAAAAAVPALKPEDVMATLEKLGDLKSKGILTQEEFDAKKAELLKKLV